MRPPEHQAHIHETALPTLEQVGIPQFDEEHMRLLELLHMTAAAARDHHNSTELREALAEILTYSLTHFSEEENVMAEAGYPELPAHRREHEKIMEQLQKHLHEYQRDPWRVAIEVINLLEEWIQKHIAEFDVPYGRFLTKNF